MMAEVKSFKYLVVTVAVLCAAVIFWAYNIFLEVTDKRDVVSNNRMIGRDIDRIVNSAPAAKGKSIQTVLTEFPRTRENEAGGLFV